MILLPALFGAFLWYIIWYYLNIRRYPRGPMPIPFFGNLLQVAYTFVAPVFMSFSDRKPGSGNVRRRNVEDLRTSIHAFPSATDSDAHGLRINRGSAEEERYTPTFWK